MRRLILGTAGHIDHGKTSLVRALTGIDTDRLPEEKRRGITIDLGFAALSLGDIELGIVDVPGHEALVRNMLAGATGIDLVIVVIAADEGVMPQTREHLAIMELLEVNAAIIALTKSDLVDADWLELVTADVMEVLGKTRFARAPIVPVSSLSGDGITTLRDAIADTARTIDARSRSDLFRLPIDRVFTLHGTGTVVTGTIWSGEVTRESHLVIMPDGASARVRGLQVHGTPQNVAGAGERVALALAVDRDSVTRGDTLVASHAWQTSMLVTARVAVLADATAPLRHRQRVRFHLGTAEILARVAMLDRPEVEPGTQAWIQLRLERPCIARAGDRFVIRSYSPVHTIAGGAIAEPAPVRRKRLGGDVRALLEALLPAETRLSAAEPVRAIEALVDLAGTSGVPADQVPVLVPMGRAGMDCAAAERAVERAAVTKAGTDLFPARLADSARESILEAVDRHHRAQPLSRGLPREDLRHIAPGTGTVLLDHGVHELIRAGQLRSDEGALARAAFVRSTDPAQTRRADELLRVLSTAGLEAPTAAELPQPLRDAGDTVEILRYLESRGLVCLLPPDRFADRAAIDQLVTRLGGGFVAGQSLTTTDLKDAIGVSRKYLIPVLEYLDRSGITSRSGESRTWNGPPESGGDASKPTLAGGA